MCCRGCEAWRARSSTAAWAITINSHRDRATAREIVPEFLRQTALYDTPKIQKSFVRATASMCAKRR